MKTLVVAAGLMAVSSFASAGSYVTVGAQAVINQYSNSGGVDQDDTGVALNVFGIDSSGLTFDGYYEFASGEADGGADYDRAEYQLGVGYGGLISHQMSAYGTVGFHGLSIDFNQGGESDDSGYQLAAGILYRTLNADLRGEIQVLEIDELSWIGFKALGNIHLTRALDGVLGVQVRQGDDVDAAAFYAGLALMLR